jgi:hypothetical protein
MEKRRSRCLYQQSQSDWTHPKTPPTQRPTTLYASQTRCFPGNISSPLTLYTPTNQISFPISYLVYRDLQRSPRSDGVAVKLPEHSKNWRCFNNFKMTLGPLFLHQCLRGGELDIRDGNPAANERLVFQHIPSSWRNFFIITTRQILPNL